MSSFKIFSRADNGCEFGSQLSCESKSQSRAGKKTRVQREKKDGNEKHQDVDGMMRLDLAASHVLDKPTHHAR